MLFPSVMVFIMMYVSSFMIVLSCNDWFLVWMGLEINMISFLMFMYHKYYMINIESCLKYFFIQSLGSLMLFILFYMNLENTMLNMMMSVILCYKIGGGPFYFWFPVVCEGISWWCCFLLMTFQKFMPLMLMSFMISNLLWIMSLISLIIGSIGCFNQINIKLLMAYSSIHHIGWMLISFMVNDMLWLMYLVIYLMMLLSVIGFFSEWDIMNVFSVINSKSKWMLLFSFLSMGGVPPFLGFFLKWWGFYYIMNYNFSMLLMMIMFSVLMLYIYFRLMYDLVMKSKLFLSWNLNMIKMSNWIQFDILIMLSFFIMSYVGLVFIM